MLLLVLLRRIGWGNFWSASVAWMLTRESFMEDITWVNMLKFKASFGQQGNDDILYPGVLLEKNYYPWLDQYKMTGANGTLPMVHYYIKVTRILLGKLLLHTILVPILVCSTIS